MWYDVVMLVILVYFMARGASRGLIWQLAGIASIILCLTFAETFSAIVGPYVDLDPPLNEWVVLFAGYLFFSFVAFGMARMINRAVEKAELKEYNRHLGALFGLTQGAAICLVLTFFLATLPAAHNIIRSSRSGLIGAKVMRQLHPAMPEKLHGALEQYIHALDDVDPNKPLLERLRDDESTETGGDDPWAIAVGETSREEDEATEEAPWWSNPLGNGRSSRTPAESPPTPATSPRASGRRTTAPPSANTTRRTGSTIPGRSADDGETPAPADSGGDLWGQIRGLVGDEARRAIASGFEDMDPATRRRLEGQLADLLQNTPTEELPKLEQDLKRYGADQLERLLRSQLPSTGPTTSESSAAGDGDALRQLLSEISRLRSPYAPVQSRMEAEVRGLMAGLPEDVALGVLRDWKADLRNDRRSDPDPETTRETSLEMRILRQMESSGMTLDDVDRRLRERLSAGAESDGQLQ